MKMTPQHFQTLKSLLEPVDTEERRTLYKESRYPRAELTKDVNKRYRWDCLYATGEAHSIMSDLYAYLNDEHIDTAMRNLVRPL